MTDVSLDDRLGLVLELHRNTTPGLGPDVDAELRDAASQAAAAGEDAAIHFLITRLGWDEPHARTLASADSSDYINVVNNLKNHRELFSMDGDTPFVALRSSADVDGVMLEEIVAILEPK
jgi:hypothetical protein